MTRPFIYGPTGAATPMFRTAHLDSPVSAPLPADFDAMIRTVDVAHYSAPRSTEYDVNEGEDLTPEEDGAL